MTVSPWVLLLRSKAASMAASTIWRRLLM